MTLNPWGLLGPLAAAAAGAAAGSLGAGYWGWLVTAGYIVGLIDRVPLLIRSRQ